jgi:nucleoside 2-deoxyribosyltransferase
MKKLVYVAGPLFSESERAFDERIAALCDDLGFATFLPHRDVGLQVEGNAEAIFSGDIRALESADLVVANLDGADVDAGTAWEIGYAVARGKWVIGLRTDRRCLEPWASVNVMIEQSSYVVRSFDALRAALNAFDGGHRESTPRPPALS